MKNFQVFQFFEHVHKKNFHENSHQYVRYVSLAPSSSDGRVYVLLQYYNIITYIQMPVDVIFYPEPFSQITSSRRADRAVIDTPLQSETNFLPAVYRINGGGGGTLFTTSTYTVVYAIKTLHTIILYGCIDDCDSSRRRGYLAISGGRRFREKKSPVHQSPGKKKKKSSTRVRRYDATTGP